MFFILQLQLVSYDTLYPLNEGTSSAVITVTRNPSVPAFTQEGYQVTVDERLGLGASVIQIAATDADEVW